MRQYDFINENGWFCLVRTGYSHIEVFGIGDKDRKIALKKAKDYCKNSFAKLNVKA